MGRVSAQVLSTLCTTSEDIGYLPFQRQKRTLWPCTFLQVNSNYSNRLQFRIEKFLAR